MEGFVLEEKQINENKIIKFYSREEGLISFLARGVQKPKSKLSTLCLPFKYLDLTLVCGWQSHILIGGKVKKVYYSIWSSWQKIFVGQKIMKDLEELAGPGKDEKIFELAKLTFEAIDKASIKNLTPLVYSFEMKLLDFAGYRPNFNYQKNTALTAFLVDDYEKISKKFFSKKEILETGKIIQNFINEQK